MIENTGFSIINLRERFLGIKQYIFILEKYKIFLQTYAYELTNLIVHTFKIHVISGNKG